MGDSNSPTQPPPLPARPWNRNALLLGGTLIAGILIVVVAGLVIVSIRAISNRLAAAEPIPGVTIVVDTGSAIDAKRVDHAAHAYLNRRLREAGYDEPGVEPIRIDVIFEKTGTIEYTYGDKVVSADKVRLKLKFQDENGRHLKTVTAEPDMFGKEEFKYDAEIALNKADYGRAVNQILKMDLPSPAELK